METAQIREINGKFALMVGGTKITKSISRHKVVQKAKELGYSIEDSISGPASPTFSIRERFEFLTNYVDMLSEKVVPSLIITGDGGLGKTYTVMDTLKKKGLYEVSHIDSESSESEEVTVVGDYAVVKGFSTARGMYNTLFEHKNRIVIFDDCDSTLKDPTALNILKGALDSYGDRWISWKSERMLGEGTPSVFKFTGQIIFISNMKLHHIDQAVRSRSICVDVSMNTSEKIERMHQILEAEEFLPNYAIHTKRQAVDFIDSVKDRANELSIRTLITVTKLAAKGGPNWKRMAEYTLTA